jgi:glycosyltransferase involved in cell wall biosynthesis
MTTIFVQRASECLTDHLPHGDGLICFSLLKGLAERGHRVFAYTNHDGVRKPIPNLTIKASGHRIPANGLADWEHSWRANQWLKEILKKEPVDVVWRMHPYNTGCPSMPFGSPRPLIIGPIFYGWPETEVVLAGRPRFGISLRSMVQPLAEAGWRRTLKKASLIFCATEPHARLIERETDAHVEKLPVIIDLPEQFHRRREAFQQDRPLRLTFVANLLSYKNPRVFCETIRILKDRGVPATGVVVGDGPERAILEKWCRLHGVIDEIQFLGRVPNSEVFQQLAQADLLISASLGEPYGRSIVEAMAMGTPALCHRSGGPADIILNGLDGFLVEDLHASGYADIVEGLYRDPELLRNASDTARDRAKAWTSAVIIDQVESALLKHLGLSIA